MSAPHRPAEALSAALVAERFPTYREARREANRKPAAVFLPGRNPAALAADLAQAVRRMALAGHHDGQIAYRLGLRRRAVARIRARHDIPAALPPGISRGRALVDGPSRPYAAG